MNAIILAAGRGSRLKGFTEEVPKCLNQVGGRPLIEWQCDALRQSGIRKIIIVTGYRSEMLEAFGDIVYHNADWDKTNMVQSLLCAKKEFSRPALVSYADILYGPELVKKLINDENALSLAYDLNWLQLWKKRFENPLEDAESFQVDEASRITEIGNKVNSLDQIQGQYTGLLKIDEVGFSWIADFAEREKERILKMDMTSMLRGFIAKGLPIYGVPFSGGWCEIDTVRDLEVAEELFNAGALSLS